LNSKYLVCKWVANKGVIPDAQSGVDNLERICKCDLL